MAKAKKQKFSNKQIVIFKFAGRNLVGAVVEYRPQGKKQYYHILGEDGKLYEDMHVDGGDFGIDTKLTKIYYKAKGIDETTIPGYVESYEAEVDTLEISEETDEAEVIEDEYILPEWSDEDNPAYND